MHRHVNSPETLLGESALQAYHADIPLGGAEPTTQDSDTILIATLLRQSLIGDPVAGARVREHAVRLARESLGAEVIARGGTYDHHPSQSDVDIIILLSRRAELAGWLRLAQNLLDTLTYLAEDPIEQGRVLACRARNARKQGHVDLSIEQSHELLRLSRRARSPELQLRALNEMAAIAQTRGNFQAFREHLQKMVLIARRARLHRMLASAHSGLGMDASMNGRFEEAITHLWSAYQESGGVGVTAIGALVNLAETLLRCGRPLESRKIAMLVLAQAPPVQSALPALGGYAIASARMGHADAVRWACAQVRRLGKSRHHPREVATALLECARALEELGELPQAGVLRRRAQSLAMSFGFHDLTFAEPASVAPAATLTGPAARIAAEIVEMDAPVVPDDFEALLT